MTGPRSRETQQLAQSPLGFGGPPGQGPVSREGIAQSEVYQGSGPMGRIRGELQAQWGMKRPNRKLRQGQERGGSGRPWVVA